MRGPRRASARVAQAAPSPHGPSTAGHEGGGNERGPWARPPQGERERQPEMSGYPAYHDQTNGWMQVAFNDDYGGSLRSLVTFTPSVTGYYYLWVRAYNKWSWGNADVYVNGTGLLAQAPFGGINVNTSWNQGDTFRVTGTQSGAPNDFMVFLLASNSQFLQLDDDSGPNLYPLATATSDQSGTSFFVAGSYPFGGGAARVTMDHNPVALCASGGIYFFCYPDDSDGDGISDALENLVGSNPNSVDTDGDGIPDNIELWGNDGFSYSEYGTVTHPDLYVEADYFVNSSDPTKSRVPYSGLPAYSADIFSSDANGPGGISAHVFVDDALPWHQYVAFDPNQTCVPGDDCVTFSSLKSQYFSPYDPSRRAYFHYALFAYDQWKYGVGSSGIAWIPGQDLLITLGDGFQEFTEAEQQGTFIHELGHNLGLTHNGSGNGNQNGPNSIVYESIMNYRYQIPGVDPDGRHTYSHGTNGCAECATSPKLACVDFESEGHCSIYPFCDCDLDDWSIVNLDFPEAGGGGGTAEAGEDKWSDAAHPAKVHPAGKRTRDEIVAREKAAIQHLRDQGYVESKDFTVTPDGLHAVAVGR